MKREISHWGYYERYTIGSRCIVVFRGSRQDVPGWKRIAAITTLILLYPFMPKRHDRPEMWGT